MSGHEIVAEIVDNSNRQYATSRESSGYYYKINTEPKAFGDIRVIADKIWNPALLLLHGDHGLIKRLEQSLGVPISLVHCVRNPFNAIATMHQRSGASLHNRARWYFMHCEAAQALIDRNDRRVLTVVHENLLRHPDQEIAALYGFFGLQIPLRTIQSIKSILFTEETQPYLSVQWPKALLTQIRVYISRFSFLTRYILVPSDIPICD
jgi:hypothetical protein